VEKKYPVPAGSVAVLYDADFMGTKAIEILPGQSSELLGTGDELESRIRPGIMGRLEEQLVPVADKAGDLMTGIDSLLTSISYVFDRESAEQLKSSIRQMKSSMDGVELMLADGGKLNVLLDNMNSISSSLEEHNEELSAAIKNMESITDSIARSDLKSTINKANLTLTQTGEIMEKINKGEGSAGLLVNDDSLYRNIVSLSQELDLLLKDLQENPKKYVNVSVFGGKDKKQK
jgi:phospholipid/cholesterol/gamma-HCH transport system substrate-binding protein